jgi:hypothetical protein
VVFVWKLFEKVAQSKAKINALDPLIVTIHSVKMPVVFGGDGRISKSRQLDTMDHVKKSIVRVNVDTNFLAHALLIAIAKVENDPNYNSYRRGYLIRPVVQQLLETTCPTVVEFPRWNCSRTIFATSTRFLFMSV